MDTDETRMTEAFLFQPSVKIFVFEAGAGTVQLSGRLIVTLSGAFTPGPTGTTRFTLLQSNGGRTGTFRSVSITYPVTAADYTPYITYDTNNVYLDLVFAGE